MATGTSLSRVFPLGSRLNERGRLEVGGCDTIELAREFGTPAYVVAEDDLRARARAFLRRGREAGHGRVRRACSPPRPFPAPPCSSCSRSEGLWCDVASGGELHLALSAGFAPERIVLHGNAKSEAELRTALRHRLGAIVIDNFDEIERLARADRRRRAARGPRGRSRCWCGSRPDVARRHPREDLHRPGRLEVRLLDGPGAARRSSASRAVAGLKLQGVHAHIGSQLLELEPFAARRAELAQPRRLPRVGPGGRPRRALHRGPAARRPRSRSTSSTDRRGGARRARPRRRGC